MIISNATYQTIPKSIGVSAGARVPSPPQLTEEEKSAKGSSFKTGDTTEGSSFSAAEQLTGEQVNDPSPLNASEGEETLQTRNEVEDRKPGEELEEDREGLAALADELSTQMSENLRIKFLKDENTGKDYFQLIEKETGEVIRQYPPDEMLRLVDQLQDVSSLIFSSQV